MIRRQLGRTGCALYRWDISDKLASYLHDLMHTLGIDPIVLCRHEATHAVPNGLGVGCSEVVVPLPDSSVSQLGSKGRKLVPPSLLFCRRPCALLSFSFSGSFATYNREMPKSEELQLAIRHLG